MLSNKSLIIHGYLFIDGLIKIKYLVHPLPSIYILQLFTCIKVPVSFDDFEQFAKNIVDLMEWQVWVGNVQMFTICSYQILILTDFGIVG